MRLSFKIFLMTFGVLMITFFVSFVVIQSLLPRLYRREFYNEYYQLMAEIEYELTAELQRELMAEIEREIEINTRMEDLEAWYETYCLEMEDFVIQEGEEFVVQEEEFREDEFAILENELAILEDEFAMMDDNFEITSYWREEDEIWHAPSCLRLFEMVENWHQEANSTWEGVQWFQLRLMRDRYFLYETGPFQVAEAVLHDFAMTNNVRIIIWEIWPEDEFGHAQLGDVLLEIDGRVPEDDPMTTLGNTEVAVRQQNHYNPHLGGFAIALTGTFQPSYRVLNIISTLQQQILIVIFFVSIAVAAIFSRYLARPIVQLSEESKKLTELEFDESIKINRRDEIGNLSSNLNFMSYKLKNTLDDLQDANEKLKKEMEREREQERQRRNLFTSISHELKTPITILKGEVGGMIDQVGDFKDRDAYLKSTYEWIETLEKLVSEILTISRLEGEKMRLDLTQIDISALLTNIYHTHKPLADNQEISFNKQIEAELMIEADESQLQIAIANVINNAIFYTQPGKSVDVELNQEGKFAVLTITNTGAYIDEEELKNLFDPFYRIDKSRNRYTGGSGLGLFIVKNILELHGFEYSIENVENGVRFTINMLLN